MEQKKRVFSGIRATGKLHLGNYLGAIKGMLDVQDKYDCVFGVVDLHTLTTPYDKETLQSDIRSVILDYLGAGLDPKKCHLIVQSQLRAEHLELAYYFGTIYQVARLEDLPTYKEKKAQHPDYVNMGLLYYPILMAADILIYKSALVPIGRDQEPHLEVTREIARKFNSMFPSTSSGQAGETFPEPQSYKTPAQYVPSLLGEGKMSKSVEGSYINLTDDLPTVKAKLAKAPTDSGKGEKFPAEGPAANIMTFVELFEGHDRAMQYKQDYKMTGIKYQSLKDELAEAIYKELKPIQERRAYFESHPEEVDKILADGAAYAKSIANETLKEVREKMGLANGQI
jgi:tryptophanyl-tRNA synthetase